MNKIANFFGLNTKENWEKHANPISVWTRYVLLFLFIVVIFYRNYLGFYTYIFILILIIFTKINPLLFKKPKSFNSWASNAVLGEMHYVNKTKSIPKTDLNIILFLNIIQLFFSIILIYGLYKLNFYLTFLSMTIVYLAKSWFLDKMVYLNKY